MAGKSIFMIWPIYQVTILNNKKGNFKLGLYFIDQQQALNRQSIPSQEERCCMDHGSTDIATVHFY